MAALFFISQLIICAFLEFSKQSIFNLHVQAATMEQKLEQMNVK